MPFLNRKGRENGEQSTEDRGRNKANSEQRNAIYVLSYCVLCAYCGKKSYLTAEAQRKIANNSFVLLSDILCAPSWLKKLFRIFVLNVW